MGRASARGGQSKVFPRHTAVQVPTAVGGDCCYLSDSAGKRYLDGSSGAAVSCLGHSNQRVREAIKRQLDTLAFAHTGFFTSEPAEALAERLVSLAPEGIDRVYFVSGGSEATEAAIKLARQYFTETGEPSRSNIIGRKQSYHGNTLGALSSGGNEWRRAQFGPMLSPAMHHVSACHYWRWGEAQETAEAYRARLVAEFEAKVEALGPETVAAFIAEPVVGATMGAVPAVPGYFKDIRQICDRHGILMILDEVMCGMGRTGALFACTQDGVLPDIVCIAKGLGAGMQPIGAMLCTGAIYEAIASGSGFFQHGHTYLGHPAACAAGLAVLDEFEDHDLIARVSVQGDKLAARLDERFGQHPHVGDIRGRGLFRGIEFVADRETKATFEPDLKIHAKLKKAAFARGLLVYPMGGTIDGRHGDHVLIAPPFIITDEEIGELVDKLGAALDDVLAA